MTMADGKCRVTVLGGGAWGTALAIATRRAGHDVRLWARDAGMIEAIREHGENMRYLPGILIDPAIEVTSDAAEALEAADHVLAALPAQQLRDGLTAIAGLVPADATIILCAKGIEQTSGKLLSSIVDEVLPGRPVAALSGPSFATDVARGLPTAVVVATLEKSRAAGLARICRPSSSAAIRRTTWSGSRSAARSRTCWRLPPARSSGAEARRQRASRNGDARLRRTAPHRRKLRRAAGDDHGPFRAGRPAVDLQHGAVTQFRLWPGARPRRPARRLAVGRRRRNGGDRCAYHRASAASKPRSSARSTICCAAPSPLTRRSRT